LLSNKGIYDTLNIRVIIDSSNQNKRRDTFATLLYFFDSLPPIFILNDDTTICYDSKINKIISTKYSTNLYSYHWYSKGELAKSWVEIKDSNDYFLRTNRLLRDTFFKVLLVSKANCGVKTSNEISIKVLDSLINPYILGDTFICFNSQFQLSLKDTMKGGFGAQEWVWEISTSNGWKPVKSNYYVFDSIAKTQMVFRLSAENNCGIRSSQTVHIDVWDELIPATITGSDTVCFGTNSNKIEWLKKPTGGGSRKYRWELKWNGGNWVDAFNYNSTDSNLSLFGLEETLIVRQQTISTNGCGELYSNQVEILTFDRVSKPLISKDSAICNNTKASLSVIKKSNGADGDFLYEWQIKQNSNWNSILDTSLKFTFSPKSSAHYRVRTVSNFGCESVFSDSTLITVYPTIEIPKIANDTILCFGSDYGLELLSEVKGGSGDFLKRWAWSLDSSDFYEEMASSDTFLINNLKSKRYIQYRVTDNYGCGTFNSDVSVISVFDSIEVSHIIGDTLICFGDEIELKLNTNPTGGSYRNVKHWSVSYDKLFKDYQLYNAINKLKLTDVKKDFFVQFSVQDSVCGLFKTPIFEIKVLDSIVPDIIGNDTNVCYRSTFFRKIVGAISEDGINERILEYSNNGQDWFKADNLGLQHEISIPTLIKNKHVRTQIITKEGCKRFSNEIFVNVYDTLKAAVIATLDTFCFRSSNNKLDLLYKPSGADNQYITSWEYFNGSQWSNLTSNSDQLFLDEQLTENLQIRFKTVSILGCGTAISEVIDLIVYDSFQPPTIETSQLLCFGDKFEPVRINKFPSGGKGNYTFNFHLLLNGNDSTLGDLKNGYTGLADFNRDVYVRVNDYCGELNSNVVNLRVNPLPDTSMINGPTQVCMGTLNCIYSLDSVKGVSYEWIESNMSTSRLKHNTQLKILVDWDVQLEMDTIKLKQIINETGCSNIMTLPIQIDNTKRAPKLTEIIRKINTNILIAKDTTQGLVYHWGYINKDLGNVNISPVISPNQRFYNYIDGIDTQKNIYFVKTFLNSCPSTSFYNYDFKSNFLKGQEFEREKELIIFPNPCSDYLSLNYDDGGYFIYSLEGALIATGCITADKINIDLRDFSNGVYLFIYKSAKGEMFAKKFIKQ
jgi:hypothetical protein